jgi:hypothetical protein
VSVLLIIVLVGYLMSWQGYKLRGKLTGLGHIALILSLSATLCNAVIARLSDAHALAALPQPCVELAGVFCVIVSVAGLYVFRLAVEKCTVSNPRVVLTLCGALTVAVGATLTTVYFAVRAIPLKYSVAAFHDPVGAVYFVSVGGYFGCTLFAVAWWMVDHTRNSERHFRRGMRISAVGLFILSVLSIGRAIPAAIVGLGGPTVIAPAFLLGGVSASAFPLVFLGLSYPLLVGRVFAYRAWRSQRGTRAKVTVVWSVCKTAYPEIVLRPRTYLQRIAQMVWNPKRLRRRSSESFDGLAKLLGHEEPARGPGAQAAAMNLREAVSRYDLAHSIKIWDVVSPDIDEFDDVVPAKPEGDQDTAMLLELANVLADVLTNADFRADGLTQPRRSETWPGSWAGGR